MSMDMVSSVPTGEGTPDPAVLQRLKRMQRIIAEDPQLQVHGRAYRVGHGLVNDEH